MVVLFIVIELYRIVVVCKLTKQWEQWSCWRASLSIVREGQGVGNSLAMSRGGLSKLSSFSSVFAVLWICGKPDKLVL